jgi:hypothetical protein
VTVTVAVDPAMEVAGISTAVASALVVVSSAQPTSSATGHASSSLRLEEDVMLQFDATHRLSELTTSWGKACSWCGFLWRAASGSHLLLSCFLSSQFVLLSLFTI